MDLFLPFQACLLVLDYYVLPECSELANECSKHTLKGLQGKRITSKKDELVTDSSVDKRKIARCGWLSWVLISR